MDGFFERPILISWCAYPGRHCELGDEAPPTVGRIDACCRQPRAADHAGIIPRDDIGSCERGETMPKGRPMKDAGNGAAAQPAKSSKLDGNGANLGFEQ